MTHEINTTNKGVIGGIHSCFGIIFPQQREVIVIKWRDTAWKDVICDIPQSAIEYLMPDLAADMDPAGEIRGIPGMELFAEGTDTDEGMR